MTTRSLIRSFVELVAPLPSKPKAPVDPRLVRIEEIGRENLKAAGRCRRCACTPLNRCRVAFPDDAEASAVCVIEPWQDPPICSVCAGDAVRG